MVLALILSTPHSLPMQTNPIQPELKATERVSANMVKVNRRRQLRGKHNKQTETLIHSFKIKTHKLASTSRWILMSSSDVAGNYLLCVLERRCIAE